MFGIGAQEMVLICLLCLVVFGPSKLPGLARELGTFARKARGAMEDLRAELETRDSAQKETPWWEDYPEAYRRYREELAEEALDAEPYDGDAEDREGNSVGTPPVAGRIAPQEQEPSNG